MLLLPFILAAAPVDLPRQLDAFLGIPYVNDEVRDVDGRWTYFAHPEDTAPSPGLNCSGFVVTATRALLGSTGSLADVTRDRKGDSGPDSRLGQDWDFGWDLVMNLSEGHPRRVLVPEGTLAVDGLDARTQRGFAIADPKAWKQVLPRLKADALYLADLSRVTKHLEHHHVGLVVRDGAHTWFYEAMPKRVSHRIDLATPDGMAVMKKAFGSTVQVLLFEVELARADAGTP